MQTKKSTPVSFDPRRPHHWLAFGFGSGLLPKAPGTWGTLAAIPIYLLVALFPLPVYVLATMLLFVVGVWVCGKAGRELGVHDHPAIVWDEVVGYLITMTAAPGTWQWMLAGFVLFRVFDILKPWPISWLDRNIGRGLGVMTDDVVAGLLAFTVIQLALLWIGQ